MKKLIAFVLVLVCVLSLVGCNSITKTSNNNMSVGITREEAVKFAQNDIKEIEKSTILNFENPTIEELVLDEKVSFYLFNANEDVEGKTVYRITFNTEQDSLLGPIVYYVDKDNGQLLGLDYRE